MSGCSSCSTCASEHCGTTAKKPTNNIKNVIGVMSGKGEWKVYYSLLAKTLASKGYSWGNGCRHYWSKYTKTYEFN